MSTVTITDEQGNKVTIPQSIWSATVEEYGKKKTWPRAGDCFWYLNDVGSVCKGRFNGTFLDDKSQQFGNFFQTEAEAEAVRDRRRAEAAIRKYIRDNGLEFEPDWTVGVIDKYHIYRDHASAVFAIEIHQHFQLTRDPHFASREHAEAVIRDCNAELKVLFGVKE